MQKITTFLMFEGNAEEAMKLYTSLFEGSSIVRIARYGENEGAPAGTVRHAVFSLGGQEIMCIDSPVKHGFTFTPATSLWVNCSTDAEIEKLHAALAHGGQILMPLGEYPFSKKYVWLSDKFGVSWQISLADAAG